MCKENRIFKAAFKLKSHFANAPDTSSSSKLLLTEGQNGEVRDKPHPRVMLFWNLGSVKEEKWFHVLFYSAGSSLLL
jgi:hypothetical protein